MPNPIVTINNTGNTFVDGVNVGAPADAIANNPEIAPAIQGALSAFVAKTQTDAAAARDAAIAAHTEAKASEITALLAKVAELTAEVAALKVE